MKKALLTFLQFLLFILTFAAGSFLTPLHIRQVLSTSPDGTHVFIWDGLLLMTLLLALILLLEQARGHIRTAARWTAIAFILAAVAGFALKLGFMTL